MTSDKPATTKKLVTTTQNGARVVDPEVLMQQPEVIEAYEKVEGKPATTNDVLDAFWIEHRGPHWERNTRHRKHCLEAGYRRGYADALKAAMKKLHQNECACWAADEIALMRDTSRTGREGR